MPQCKGKTKKGTRCSRNIKKGETYCFQHKRKSPKKSGKPKGRSTSKTKRVSQRSKSKGCKRQSQKKYVIRSSPSYPANECCGKTMRGNDGIKYKSVKDVNGVCRWKKVK